MLEIFNYENQEIRTILKDSEPWFVLADVCKILDISNPSRVAADVLDEADLSTTEVRSGGQNRKVNIINEPALYQVAFQSRKPEVAAVQTYFAVKTREAEVNITPQLTDDQFIAKALQGWGRVLFAPMLA